jgi:hypothetical protein
LLDRLKPFSDFQSYLDHNFNTTTGSQMNNSSPTLQSKLWSPPFSPSDEDETHGRQPVRSLPPRVLAPLLNFSKG